MVHSKIAFISARIISSLNKLGIYYLWATRKTCKFSFFFVVPRETTNFGLIERFFSVYLRAKLVQEIA